MKTVPTLCASATVVGVSAAGLALGRPEPARPATPFAPPAAAREAVYRRRSRAAAAPAHREHRHAPAAKDDGRRASHRRRSRAVCRRGRGRGCARQREAAAFMGQALIHRLASQTSTRTASPLPPSPAFSYSNGSTAFSQDGSTAPIVGNAAPAHLPPNKLVKRSTSVRHPGAPDPQRPSSARPSLRRPATSHQRSRTLDSPPAFLDAPPGRIDGFAAAPSPLPDPDVRWMQYFSAKGTVVKRRGLSGHAKVITRIVPSEKHHPTLVLADVVTAPTVEMEDSSSQAGDSDDARSPPQTPAVLDFAPLGPAPFSETPAEALGSPETGREEEQTRHSFSISDMFGTIPQPRKPQGRRRLSADRIARTVTRKLTSAKTGSARNDPGTMTNGDLERLPKLPKPRDTSRPVDSPREIYSSNSSHNRDDAHASFESSSRSCSPVLESRTVSLSNTSNHASSRVPSQQGYTPPNTRPVAHRPASPSAALTRPSRLSITPSEQASTLVGSDNEARLGSGEESDTDFQSDTVFDSTRTRGTRTSSGARGPTIETIFDESPPSIKHKISSLRDLLPKGIFPEPDRRCITEEEESNFSTPVRTIIPDRGNGGSPTPAARTNSRFSTDIPSAPPKPLSLGTLEWDINADDGDDGRWSFDDEDSDGMWNERTASMHFATPLSIKLSNPIFIAPGSSPVSTTTAPRLSADNHDKDARSSIFDWSEPVAERSAGNRTPPRPNTVHGKKDTKGRGSRSVSRRAPSGLHARSQSVPIVPDVAGKRDTLITNKFGTWGVGSKGVTEDWNDDFDFSGCGGRENDVGDDAETRLDSPSAMFVPKSIRDQQTNVLANIGLLREWGLLIEELKELRARAVNLHILDGPFIGMWQEVDAMIDLADQEVDDPAIVPRLSPPSSPGFDADAFDEVPQSTPASGLGRGLSILQARRESLGNGASPALSAGAKTRRRSILHSTDDIFSSPSTPRTPQDTPQATPLSNRPRKNSEAVARSVIEALQKRKSTTDPLSPQPIPPTKKVPFDTATLRHIVPYVNGLMRRVKEALRETERLYSSPTQTPRGGEASFNPIFGGPLEESPTARRSRPRSRMNLSDKTFETNTPELVKQQMKLMTVM